jgi:hypothetical protein
MSDLRRLLDSSDSRLARTLLRAGRTSAPPGARRRAIAAATSAVAATSLTATAAGGTLARVGTVAALKWLGVGVACVGSVGAGIALHERASQVTPRHASEPVLMATTASVPVAVRAPDAPASSPRSAPEPSIAPPLVVAAPAPAPARFAAPERSIREEVVVLKRASSALASGDATLALSILRDYGARFPDGSMASEAAVLRIEALARAGDASAARRAAESFLVAYPQSPYAERVRSVVGSNP